MPFSLRLSLRRDVAHWLTSPRLDHIRGSVEVTASDSVYLHGLAQHPTTPCGSASPRLSPFNRALRCQVSTASDALVSLPPRFIFLRLDYNRFSGSVDLTALLPPSFIELDLRRNLFKDGDLAQHYGGAARALRSCLRDRT